MLVYAILFFAYFALLFYLLFGGADYGAGILELFKGNELKDEQTKLINKAMGPVWEANHIWLIILVVILFCGFPTVYSTMSIALHIPLVFALLGIVLRGCAFTFRHYDAYQDETQKIYTWVFVLASLITPFWLGVVGGGMILGEINLESQDPYEAYIRPWLSPFCMAMGLFVCSLFAMVASVLLVEEATKPSVKDIFVRRAEFFGVTTVLLGGLVFLSAESVGLSLAARFIASPISLLCMVLATGALFLLRWSIRNHHKLFARLGIGGVVSLILAGWFAMSFPNVLALKHGSLDFFSIAAPPETLRMMLLALMVGFALVIPTLIYLLRVFKFSRS